jgi:hypothetical protein
VNDIKLIESKLEFDSRIKSHLVTGCKTYTIRKGHRHFATHITIGDMSAIVNSYKHYILLTTPLEILVKEGYRSIFDCLHKLGKYYPDITLSTPITVIEFRLDVESGGSTHR